MIRCIKSLLVSVAAMICGSRGVLLYRTLRLVSSHYKPDLGTCRTAAI